MDTELCSNYCIVSGEIVNIDLTDKRLELDLRVTEYYKEQTTRSDLKIIIWNPTWQVEAFSQGNWITVQGRLRIHNNMMHVNASHTTKWKELSEEDKYTPMSVDTGQQDMTQQDRPKSVRDARFRL